MPESRQEAPRHILHYPEVGREEAHDQDEAGNEGGGDKPAEEVQPNRHQLEEQVEEDHEAVGGAASSLHHQPKQHHQSKLFPPVKIHKNKNKYSDPGKWDSELWKQNICKIYMLGLGIIFPILNCGVRGLVLQRENFVT